MLDITGPLMRRWAESHGYDYHETELCGPLPPSWNKIDVLIDRLNSGNDAVIWIDCDVVVMGTGLTPLSEMLPHHKQGLVVHHTECGEVPNCGVWVVRSSMSDTLAAVKEMSSQLALHPWWEQAAVMRLMGYSINPVYGGAERESSTPLFEDTAALHPRWNWHPADAAAVAEPAFYHITQKWDGDARLEQIRRLACRSR